MTDRQDRHDDIHLISQRLESIKTVDPNLNPSEESSSDSPMSKAENISSSSAQKKKSCTYENNWETTELPGKNIPEKILFIIDTAKEIDCTPYEMRTGVKLPPLNMIKRVVEIFVTAKAEIQPKHEYALMSLKSDRVSWLCNFTNSRYTFLNNLEKIEEEAVEKASDVYDLGPCFDAVFAAADVPDETTDFVFRVILIYARSRSLPVFLTETGRRSLERLYDNSRFYLDCLYAHDPPSEENSCQNVYSNLSALDQRQTSYILEAGRNLAALHTNMAKLIAHPLQRTRQSDAPYSFCCSESTREA